MQEDSLLRWDGTALLPVSDPDPRSAKMQVCDSWLVQDGRVRELLAHYRRFSRSLTILTKQQYDLWEFFESVTDALPRTGRWFPRMECLNDERGETFFQLRLRPAAEQQSNIRLLTWPGPDPRTSPLVKGPDLALLMQLRRGAQMHNADEAVLLDRDGLVIEGAMSAIVWWDGETLVFPNMTGKALPSITKKIVLLIAEGAGVEVRSENVTPMELAGKEIWSLGALHGIRLVRSWQLTTDGDLLPVASSGRHKLWQRRLTEIAAGLP